MSAASSLNPRRRVSKDNRYSTEEHPTTRPDTATKILFIAGIGPIDRDVAKSRALYADSLGIPFKQDAGGYLYTGALEGALTLLELGPKGWAPRVFDRYQRYCWQALPIDLNISVGSATARASNPKIPLRWKATAVPIFFAPS
jgi:hypothetical protein